MLIVDETGFLKKGVKSVGVQRQYSGTAGRIENCQIGVFLGYASATGRAFLDRELYLPQEWAGCRAAARSRGPGRRHIRDEARTRHADAGARLRGRGAGCLGDRGRDLRGRREVRRWLAEDHPYVVAVSCSAPVWHDGTQERADRLIASLPPEAWGPLSGGAGSQGERLYDWACVRLPYERASGTAQWLLAPGAVSAPTACAYFRVFGPATTALDLVRVAGMRWAIEASFEDAKGAVGLDHYEVRTWTAWYRHVTLALLAHAYLQVIRHQANGEEKGGGRSAPADGAGGSPLAARSPSHPSASASGSPGRPFVAGTRRWPGAATPTPTPAAGTALASPRVLRLHRTPN